MATDFGTDISAAADLDPGFATISGMAVLGQALARRLQTPRGGLFYDPGYGYDVRELLAESLDDAALFRAKAVVEAQAEEDPRVSSATAEVAFDPDARTLKMTLSLQTASGPFDLVLSVSRLSVDVLNLGNS